VLFGNYELLARHMKSLFLIGLAVSVFGLRSLSPMIGANSVQMQVSS